MLREKKITYHILYTKGNQIRPAPFIFGFQLISPLPIAHAYVLAPATKPAPALRPKVEAGQFSNQSGRQLALLHPRQLSVYQVKTDGGGGAARALQQPTVPS